MRRRPFPYSGRLHCTVNNLPNTLFRIVPPAGDSIKDEVVRAFRKSVISICVIPPGVSGTADKTERCSQYCANP